MQYQCDICKLLQIAGRRKGGTGEVPRGACSNKGIAASCDMCRDPGYGFNSPYKLPNGQETSKWLLLQVGTDPRTMPIALISNTSITEREWQKWKDHCNAHNKPQLNTHDCDSALQRIKKASS